MLRVAVLQQPPRGPPASALELVLASLVQGGLLRVGVEGTALDREGLVPLADPGQELAAPTRRLLVGGPRLRPAFQEHGRVAWTVGADQQVRGFAPQRLALGADRDRGPGRFDGARQVPELQAHLAHRHRPAHVARA